jgi:hypothetical protein
MVGRAVVVAAVMPMMHYFSGICNRVLAWGCAMIYLLVYHLSLTNDLFSAKRIFCVGLGRPF